jgi:arylsulfatase A-like enzyme
MKQLGIALLLIASLMSPAPVSAQGQPDIVVLMVDDLGAIDERILERLPNIKSLFLDAGLRFDQAYGQTPWCCPGRASFLTGQDTRHHHVTRLDARLLDPSQTIATALNDAGYQTMLIGKYLNLAELLEDRIPDGWDVADLMLQNDGSTSTWWLNGTDATLGYMDRQVGTLALTELAAAPADAPLFMWLTPRAPHRWAGENGTLWIDDKWQPWVEPQYATDPRCEAITPWKPPSYVYSAAPEGWPLDEICRSLLTVDDWLGQLRDAFSLLGRDPLWVLTSDNGMAWGAHGFPQKNVPWAHRLPLYFAGPGVTPGATFALVSNIDFGPTLAELAGTSMPWADGVSFAGVLSGGASGRAWMLEDHPEACCTEGRRYGPYYGIRTPTWHLIKKRNKRAVLYNVAKDPWELRPVSNAVKKRQLMALYPY